MTKVNVQIHQHGSKEPNPHLNLNNAGQRNYGNILPQKLANQETLKLQKEES